VAEMTSISWSLSISGIGALLAIPLTWRYKLGSAQTPDLAPSMHWPAPIVSEEVKPDRGPVLVSIEYRVDATRRAQFLEAMQSLRRIRRRDGAFFWEVFQDAADATRFVECFMAESWVEHLRQHERVTHADREAQRAVEEFLVDGVRPRATHLIAATKGSDDGRTPGDVLQS
jgi:hypothetical protein